MAKKNKKIKVVTVYLFGGLGNQLFQYFSGLAICEAYDAQLILKPVGRGSNNSEDIGLLAFQTQGQIVRSRIPMHFLEFGLRRFSNLVDKFGLENFLQSFGLIMSNCGKVIHGQIRATRHIRLLGYFQDLVSVRYLADKRQFRNPQLRDPSKWFRAMSSELLNTNPIVVHIRRDDYLNYRETLGVLDLAYYRSVIEAMPYYYKRNIWIFSDSLEVAYRFNFELNLPEGQTRIVIPPQGTSDAESLMLMSLASTVVISNSTFSYWAAYFSSNEAVVISPKKWFRGMQDPDDLYPAHWRTFDSIWMP